MQSVSVTSYRNLADRRIPETQGRMDSFQEKTRGGRGIQQEQAVIPLLSKTTVNAYVHQRPISDYTASKDPSGGVREMVCIREKEEPAMTLSESMLSELNDNCKAGVTVSVQYAFFAFLKKFCKNQQENSCALRLCLLVTQEIWRMLKYSHHVMECEENFSFMQTTFGRLYTDNLYPALQILQDKITSGRGWEYVNKLNRLAQYFSRFFLNDDPDKAMCRDMIVNTYLRFLHDEIDYLNYIVYSPLRYSVRNSVNIMDLMLNISRPALFFGFLTEQEANIFRGEQMNLLMRVNSNLNDKGVDKKNKTLGELWETLFLETADVWAARRYHDELRWRIDEVMIKSVADDISDQQRFCLLETLIEFNNQYGVCIREFHILREALGKRLIDVAMLILIAIIPIDDNADYFKMEVLLLMRYMYEKEMLDGKCKQLYFLCMPQQKAAEATHGTDPEIYRQCMRKVNLIFQCFHVKHDNCWLAIARLLKKLFDEYQSFIMEVDGTSDLRKSIDVLEYKLYQHFFLCIFDQYREYKNRNQCPGVTDKEMSMFRIRILELEPYVFAIPDRQKNKWKAIVCSAWNRHIYEMSKKQSFNKDDIDSLLALKRMVPDIPYTYTMQGVRRVLWQILSFMLQYARDSGYALIEGVMELSRWIDDLGKIYPISDAVTLCNAQWKEKYELIMSAKVAASSDMSAGTLSVSADSADSGVEGVSPAGAAGCHPHAGQSITPGGTQPLTAPSDIPVPATCRASQQPVLVLNPLPVFQSEASIGFSPVLPPLPVSVLQNASAGDREQSYFPEHFQGQACFRPLPACALVQPQRQTAWQQQSLYRQSTASPEYRPEYPWVSGLQHRLEWFAESTGPVHLPPVNHETSQMPIQNAGDQRTGTFVDDESARSQLLPCHQSFDLPLPFQYPFGLPTSVFTPDPALEVCLRQYRPVDYATCEMGNGKVALGQRYLLCITNHYLQQKQNGAWGPTPEIHLPANLGSCYYPAFVQGMAYLVNWLFQINDGFMARDDIRQPLKRLYHEDGAAMIRNLFDRLVQYQGSIGNFNILSNLVGLRNYLLYVRSLPGLENDNQLGCCPGQ